MEVIHIAGKDNLFSDFASRNPITCTGSCQICTFISNFENSSVGSLQVEKASSDGQEVSAIHLLQVSDILSGRCQVPYASRKSWLQIQQSCPDLMKARQFLIEGITPSGKTQQKNPDIRRYVSCATISSNPNDGMVIVKRSEPFVKSEHRIVVPRQFAPGVMTALHLELQHPSVYQLEKVFARAFFALDLRAIATSLSYMCSS